MSDFESADQLAVHEAARRGDSVRILELCSNMSPAHINARNDDGLTALHVASGSGHMEAVRAIVFLGADPAARDHNNDTALHIAASMGHTEVVRVLIEEGGADMTSAGGSGNTPLHCAAKAGCTGTVEFLVSKHPSLVDAVDSDGLTPVELAAEGGFADAVRALAVMWSHRCARALHIASSEGNLAIIECLMHVEGSDVNVADEVGDTPLHVAADFGQGEAVRALVRFHADVAAVNLDDEAPLHLALRGSHFIAVAALLRHLHVDDDANHAEVVRSAWRAYGKPCNADGSSYLHWAVVSGAVGTLKVLVAATPELSFDAEADAKGMKPLHVASGSRNVETVRALLEMGCDVNARDFNNDTALHIAASMGHTEVVRVLIEEGGADGTAVDGEGSTALHHAAVNRQMEVVELLLVSMVPADTSVRNKEGLTPLSIAARGGKSKHTLCFLEAIDARESFVNQMLDAVALAASTCNGKIDEVEAICSLAQFGAGRRYFPSLATPASVPNKRLHFAAAFGHRVAVAALISGCKDDVNAADCQNRTPLHWAASAGHGEMVSQLMQRGAHANPVDEYGNTPLHMAVHGGHTDAVLALLVKENRVKVNAIDNQGLTPLHWAAGSLHSDLASILIREGRASIDILDMHGRKPVHHAACSLCDKMLSVLIREGGANVNTLDKDNRTPLHYAAASGNVMAISILIEEHDADINAKDTHGRTPLHDAARAGYAHAVLSLCRGYGADVNVMDKEGNTPLRWAQTHGWRKASNFLVQDILVQEHERRR